MTQKRDPSERNGEEPVRLSDTRELGPVDSRRWPSPDARREAGYAALVELAGRLRPEDGAEAVARQGVARLAQLLPGRAVGARIARNAPSDGWLVVEAAGGVAPRPTPDGTRLFPQLSHERVARLEENGGSTLHVAGDAPELADAGSVDSGVAERAAVLLALALEHARTHELLGRSRREIERLQARIIQGEKLASLGQIVANVVHELNNPLTCIRTYAGVLGAQADAESRSEQERERLRRIAEAAERALGFARDLTDYARPATETHAAVCLQDVIQKALTFCQHELSAHGIQVVRDLGESPPRVIGVAGHLVQVFVNLFTNAAQAMNERGGELRVSARVVGDTVSVEVADTGIGVEATSLEHIFEPYFTTRECDRGTGLGLAIVRDIVTAHGGEIGARSTVGRGTTFSFTLRVPRFL